MQAKKAEYKKFKLKELLDNYSLEQLAESLYSIREVVYSFNPIQFQLDQVKDELKKINLES